MGATSKSNELETRGGIQDYFVAFLTRSLLRSENNSGAIVLAMTFVLIATISVVIQTLKTHRRSDYSPLLTKYKKRLDTRVIDDRIDVLSIDENFDAASVPKQEPMDYERILSELHIASNKCFIRKYAERCAKLVNYCPFLINAKCGSTGLTPFHRVCFHGHAALIEFMLSKGADPHLSSHSGANAISLVMFHYLGKPGKIERSDMRCLDILRQAGTKLEGNSIWYDMLLKKALQSGKTALAEWLINNRIIPEARSFKRHSSLSLVY